MYGRKNPIDPVRLERQQEGAKKWRDSNGKGTLEYATGIGKTFVAINLIMKAMNEKNSNRDYLVIVPKVELKKQWEKELTEAGITNATVRVINGFVDKQEKVTTNLLVLDEIHRYASTKFSKVFELVDYEYILGLTATIERLDKKHVYIEKYCPVIDRIRSGEAKRKGWTSEYTEYALKIVMSEEEKKTYDQLNQTFYRYFSKFYQDFDLAMNCMNDENIRKKHAQVMGWEPSMGPQHPWAPNMIMGYAIKFAKSMNARKKFLHNLPSKAKAIKRIVERFKVKTILFSESTDFAERIDKELGKISVLYHSQLKAISRTREVRHFDINGNVESTEVVVENRSAQYRKANAIRTFKYPKNEVRVISTAKALDEGFNVEDIELAVISSYTSNPTQQIQRKGRATRKFQFADGKHKKAMVIYMYAKDTQEERWFAKSVKNNTSIQYVNDVDEIGKKRRLIKPM